MKIPPLKMHRQEKLRVGISQDGQGSELSVLVSFVHGEDGGRERERESSREAPPLEVFLHALEEWGLCRLLFWSFGKEIRKS